jgi:protein-disulfide isomerase
MASWSKDQAGLHSNHKSLRHFPQNDEDLMTKLLPLALISTLALAGCDTGGNTSAATKPADAVTAPAGTNWTETFSVTPDGGMLRGNPDAAIKLVEYGALTCSHCAEFAESSKEGLNAMIASGKVSFEVRNFMLNVMDVPAALLARCGGAGPFFPISEQMFATQAEWLGKAQTITPAEQQAWQSLQPEQLAPLLAQKLGLDAFVQARGISADKAQACLADRKAIDQLGEITQRAQTEFNVTGTPTFVLNGKTVPNVGDWKTLEPVLKDAGA